MKELNAKRKQRWELDCMSARTTARVLFSKEKQQRRKGEKDKYIILFNNGDLSSLYKRLY
jgi:hypothetical protein